MDKEKRRKRRLSKARKEKRLVEIYEKHRAIGLSPIWKQQNDDIDVFLLIRVKHQSSSCSKKALKKFTSHKVRKINKVNDHNQELLLPVNERSSFKKTYDIWNIF